MDYLKIRNWDKWQSYRKDRGQPPWIKVHRRLMRNPEWVSLTDAERGQLVVMWLLAGDHDGVIPASPDVIQKLCYLTKPPDLNKFTNLGFIENGWRHVGVTLASSGSHDVTPKAEAEKNRIKKSINTLEHREANASDYFEAFWNSYPKKKNKQKAKDAWKKIKEPASTLNAILISLEWQKNTDQWMKENGQFIPYPASYLNARAWEDEPDGNKKTRSAVDEGLARFLASEDEPGRD